jgi:hypothetical protein
MLLVGTDVIADLGQHLALDILESKSAVTDHLAGLLQAYRPEAESVIFVAVHVAFYPASYPLFIENIGIMFHDLLIRQNGKQSIKIIHVHFSKKKSVGLNNPLHKFLPVILSQLYQYLFVVNVKEVVFLGQPL